MTNYHIFNDERISKSQFSFGNWRRQIKSSLIIGSWMFCAVALMLLSACSPQQPKAFEPKIKETDTVATREAVYIYEEQQTNEREIVLRIGSEPRLIKQSYARLAGVVSGERSQALVEDAGKGICLSAGDNFKGYKVQTISDDQIILRLERK